MKSRKVTSGLLPLMEARPWKDGKTVTYRYHPIGGKPINLGTDRDAAIRKVLDSNGRTDTYGTLQWVWESYQTAPRWLRLASGTRADYTTASKPLLRVFGNMQMAAIRTTMIARYVRIERADAPRRANIEKALLSNLFGHAIDLGVCEANATTGVQPNPEEPRTEAPSPATLARFLTWMDRQKQQYRVLGMAAEFAAITGNRKVEFLGLTRDQIDHQAGEVRMLRAKQRGKKREVITEVVQITPRLAGLLNRLEVLSIERMQQERRLQSQHLFPTRSGGAYTASGVKATWSRIITRALEEGVITADTRFTFHDLRAYYVTEHKFQHQTLPDLHANPETTARVYDRNKVVHRLAL